MWSFYTCKITVIPLWQWWSCFPDGVFKQWRNRQFMNVIVKRWDVLGGCGYVVQYWVECVALLPWIQGVIYLLKRQFLVYSAAFVYSSPFPARVLVITLICMEYLPLRRLQGSTRYRFCLCVMIVLWGSTQPCSCSLSLASAGGQAFCLGSASLKSHFALPSTAIANPSFMACTLRPSTGRGRLIRLNCRALCRKGVWGWWFNPERSAKTIQTRKSPKPFNNVLPISAGLFFFCAGVCVCVCVSVLCAPKQTESCFLKRNQPGFDIYLHKE